MEIVMIKGVNNNLLFWRTKMEFICLSKKESVFLSPYRALDCFIKNILYEKLEDRSHYPCSWFIVDG
jgi:hypothetical protein